MNIQWMFIDSGAEKSTLAVDRLQSLLQKSLTFEVSYKKLTLLHCYIATLRCKKILPSLWKAVPNQNNTTIGDKRTYTIGRKVCAAAEVP